LMQSDPYAGPGLREVLISPAGLPSGMYNVSIQTAKGRTAHRRLAVAK